jgi:hypothetical protein
MAWQNPPPIYDGEDERALKLDFARRWALNPSRVLSIGYEVFPGQDNYGRAMQAQVWRHDPTVIAEYERLTGGEEVIPGEEEPKPRILRELRQLRLETGDRKVQLDSLKLKAEIEGLTGKGGNVNVNVDNRSVRNVLLVPHYENLDDFAAKLKTQQTHLLANAKSPARVTG